MQSLGRTGAIVFLLALTVRAAGSVPQRGLNQIDGAPTGPRTGLIVGQVVDSTGAPVPEAIVYMSYPKYFADLATTPKGRVMADSEGRFFFSDLPAGEYSLRATKEGYAGGVYGQRRANGDSQRLLLAEGERLADAKLALWKHAVIGGTVLDEAGEPVIGVNVQALVKDVVGGRTRYGPGDSTYLIPTATTDDRGMFRLSSLLPGRYVIVVPSTLTTVPIALLGQTNDVAVRNEIFRAIQEISSVGQPRNVQVGDVAMMTANRTLIPPPASAAGRMEVYRTTYFSSVTTASAATVIAVAGGEERTDLRIGLKPVPAVKISGRLVTPEGNAPLPTSLRLVGESAAEVGEEGFETVTGISDASGRFTLLGVPAGEYTLRQATMLSLNGLQGRPGWWFDQRITVGAADIQDLVVQAKPTLQIAGRLEFWSATPPSPSAPVRSTPPSLINAGTPFETPNGEPGRFVGQPGRGEPTFSTIASAGRYILRPNEIGGWFVKSVTLDSKDITDRVFDLQTDATTFVVTYTDVTSTVTGIVKDARGVVSTTAAVLAFPVDPQRWTGHGTSRRNFKSTVTSRTGAYAFTGLPAGDYFLVAIDDADANGWMDPRTLETLARQATRLTIADVDAKTVDLTVKVVR